MSKVTEVTVKTVEDKDGFKDAGPLTTTFTPPAACTKIFSTTSSRFAVLGDDDVFHTSCYPEADILIRAYFMPGLACPSGWGGEPMVGTGSRTVLDPSSRLPQLTPGETATVCCPSGLRYAETILSFAPGVGGWCLGTLTQPTSIEPEACANCDTTPTPLPTKNAAGTAYTLLQTTILLRREAASAGSVASTGSTTGTSASSSTSSNRTSSQTTPPSSNSNQNSSGGDMSTGAKAGIAIGVVLAVLALAVAAFFVMRQRKRKRAAALLPVDDGSGGAKEMPAIPSTRREVLGDTAYKPHELYAGYNPGPPQSPVELDANQYAYPELSGRASPRIRS
ncbi:hypothetical protein B0T24DRAFT_291660 [Lasiosphaeria ovina]|uniref:LPXTG-domain-containing protein n=1 Tax=Lasiosphaeria ovina TaxID=92902 RepID=A0AAE0KDR9_9PEZI|nr:hypothetical protein B0T24DRAFT_291660 [Lasiosphaeria ovina]